MTLNVEISVGAFLERLSALRSDEELRKYQRYFRFRAEDQPADDYFIGVRMGQVFELAKEFMDLPVDQVEVLLESPVHEARAGAVSIVDFQARSRKTSEQRRKELFDLFIRRHDRINNWDLVDRAAPHVVGGYLYDKPRDVLYKLAASRNIWERRTAIVSTAYFIRKGDLDDTFGLAEFLVNDADELVNKGTGWMLRAAGDKDRDRLLAFLDRHAAAMPRTLLRYAIEKLDKTQRGHYLALKKAADRPK